MGLGSVTKFDIMDFLTVGVVIFVMNLDVTIFVVTYGINLDVLSFLLPVNVIRFRCYNFCNTFPFSFLLTFPFFILLKT